MFTSDTIWGIDIGDSCVKAVKLRKTKSNIFVEDYSYIELEQEIKEKDGQLASIQDALERLVSRKIFSRSEACLTISAKNINNRFISVPSDKGKQFEQAIEKEARRQIPFPLDEVQWGYYRMPDREDEAQIALFAARNDHINEILDVALAAGINVRGIQAPGLALFNFVNRISEIDEHLIILDFGEKTTDLLVIHDKALWLRSLPLSGSHITSLLEQKFRITTKEANTLKLEMERSSQKDKLFRVIEPKLKDLVIEIKRSINFRKTQVHELEPTKFLACGGSSQLPGVQNYFVRELRLDPFKLDLDELDLSSCPDPQGLEDNIVSYGVAIGLALQGLEEAEADLNLIPQKFVLKQTFRSKRVMALAANFVFFLMILSMYFSGTGVIKKLDENLKKAQAVSRNVNGEISSYSSKAKELDPVVEKSGFLSRFESGGSWAAEIYSTVQGVVEGIKDIYIVSMRLTPFRPEHYFHSDGTEEGASAAYLELTYLGGDAKINKSFVVELLKNDLFKVKKDEKEPVEVGKTETYRWTFNPSLPIDAKDPFAEDEKVRALRREKGWDFVENKEKVNEYARSRGTIRLKLNLDSLLGPAPVQNEEEDDD